MAECVMGLRESEESEQTDFNLGTLDEGRAVY